MKKLCYVVFFCTIFPISLFAQQEIVIPLPAPMRSGGMPLMEALANRKSAREYIDKPLTQQQLSDLLWAAWGINRSDGRRTAPTARNMQEIDLYVFDKEGISRYDAARNVLIRVAMGDFRKETGSQDFQQNAALNLVLVSDYNKMGAEGKTTERHRRVSAMNAGYISQNIYLYATSAGLSSVARLMFDADKLAKILKLPAHQAVVLTQTVGYSAL